MKFLIILGLVAIGVTNSMAIVAPQPPISHNPIRPGVMPTPPPAPTMAIDLDAIQRMINMVQLRQLMHRYLLNDPEFQTFVRIINTHDAFITYLRFRSQPEVMTLWSWLQAQIMASGGEFQLELESEEIMGIINPTPYWSNTVFGWQGFVNEFLMYYPQDMIREHIAMKVRENGIMAQLWQRLVALKPVYERVIASPEAQRVAAKLQANAIDATQLDDFIRHQFGWQLSINTTMAPIIASSPTVSNAPAMPAA